MGRDQAGRDFSEIPYTRETATDDERPVLVVLREPLLRMLASDMLTDAGLDVVPFGTAAEAAQFCDDPRHAVGAVLSDVSLGGDLDGLGLATYIARKRPDVHVVVTSALHDRVPLGLSGRVSYLPKPFSQERLIQAIGLPVHGGMSF